MTISLALHQRLTDLALKTKEELMMAGEHILTDC
jgi:hypothetical protein